jgi:hypothetical protein
MLINMEEGRVLYHCVQVGSDYVVQENREEKSICIWLKDPFLGSDIVADVDTRRGVCLSFDLGFHLYSLFTNITVFQFDRQWEGYKSVCGRRQ